MARKSHTGMESAISRKGKTIISVSRQKHPRFRSPSMEMAVFTAGASGKRFLLPVSRMVSEPGSVNSARNRKVRFYLQPDIPGAAHRS